MEHRTSLSQAPFGFINLYKEAGQTSTHVGTAVRRALESHYGLHSRGTRLALGHMGTLDPDAQGVLPLAVGKATRLLPFIADRTKVYRFTLVLGRSTLSGDATGEECESASVPDNSRSLLTGVLSRFHGRISQIPPMVSALHHEGRRLYALAREGKIVERPPREIEIFSLALLNDEIPNSGSYRLRVHCSEGTYVRTLCEDLARAIGTVGHMDQLFRDVVGPFTHEKSVKFSEILTSPQTACLDPRKFISFQERLLNPRDTQRFAQGQRLSASAFSVRDGFVFMLTAGGEADTSGSIICGVAECQGGALIPRTVFV